MCIEVYSCVLNWLSAHIIGYSPNTIEHPNFHPRVPQDRAPRHGAIFLGIGTGRMCRLLAHARQGGVTPPVDGRVDGGLTKSPVSGLQSFQSFTTVLLPACDTSQSPSPVPSGT